MTLSIFFPCYNDVHSIGALIADAEHLARKLAEDYEILVVDDGSEDGSRELLDSIALSCPKLRVIKHESNRGYGGALRTGFSNSRMELVFYTDGDGQYRLESLESLWELMIPGVDVVNGYKQGRSDPWYRIVAGRLYLAFVRQVFRLKIRDVDCDFRIIRRSALSRITLTQDSGLICIELVKRLELAGHKFVEMPVAHHPRLHGSSQFFKPGHVLKTLSGMAGMWWNLMVRRETAVDLASRVFK